MDVKVPLPLVFHVTVPVGVDGFVCVMSETVAMQVVAWFG